MFWTRRVGGVRATGSTTRTPEVDPDDPFCNNWKACAEGVIGLVTIGVSLAYEEDRDKEYTFIASVYPPDARDLFADTCERLRWAITPKRFRFFTSIVGENDRKETTRADVRRWFTRAIEDSDAS